ncbi:Ctr copper transporter, partial [Phyllosticta citribraziliensis]
MLWNWNTIDACFLSSSWHITSKGMFAGSCIGVILLVMALEFLRRTAKEYDRMLLRQHQRAIFASNNSSRSTMPAHSGKTRFRPNLVQQLIRALLHMVQFAVAYFVMLLAMYFNGYIIICIFIGAFLGSFVF